jgi:WD40 repeat protein
MSSSKLLAENFFSSEPDITISAKGPLFLASGDINGDGKNDLAVSSRHRMDPKKWIYDKDNEGILIFYQKEPGVFEASADKKIKMASPSCIQIADIDSDGKNELIAGKNSNGFYLFRQTGNSFKEDFYPRKAEIRALFPGKSVQGKKQAIISNGFWLPPSSEGFKNGYFFSGKTLKDRDNKSLFVSDLNFDGFDDVIFAGSKEKVLRIYYSPFMDKLVFPQDVEFRILRTPCLLGTPKQGITVGDFNHDGRPDIAISPAKDNNIYIFHQNMPCDFYDKAQPSARIEETSGAIASADINNDGFKDLIVAENKWKNSKILIFFSIHKRQKLKKENANITIDLKDNHGTAFLMVQDINNDGLPDITASSNHGVKPGFIRIYINKHKKINTKKGVETNDASAKK